MRQRQLGGPDVAQEGFHQQHLPRLLPRRDDQVGGACVHGGSQHRITLKGEYAHGASSLTDSARPPSMLDERGTGMVEPAARSQARRGHVHSSRAGEPALGLAVELATALKTRESLPSLSIQLGVPRSLALGGGYHERQP